VLMKSGARCRWSGSGGQEQEEGEICTAGVIPPLHLLSLAFPSRTPVLSFSGMALI